MGLNSSGVRGRQQPAERLHRAETNERSVVVDRRFAASYVTVM